MGDLFIMGATFLAVSFLTYGVVSYRRNRQMIKSRFMKPEVSPRPLLRKEEQGDSLKKRLLDWVTTLGKIALKDHVGVSQLRQTLIQAGYRQANAPALYFGLRALLAFTLPIPYLMWPLLTGKTTTVNLPLAFVFVGAGYFLPHFLLNARIRRRQDRLDQALPDVLDLMIVSMEAGLSMQSTLSKVADEIKPISPDFYGELQLTNAEMRTGLPRDLALKNLGERTGVQSIKSLVALMVQSEKMGSSIAQALRTHADFSRVARAQKAEEMAQKIPVKILFPTLVCIFPSIFIVILGPAGIQISKTFLKV